MVKLNLYIKVLIFIVSYIPFVLHAQSSVSEPLYFDSIPDQNLFKPMSIKINLLGFTWPATNKLHMGYEHNINNRNSMSILFEYGYFQDERYNYDVDIREQRILYAKGYGVTGEFRHYFNNYNKSLRFFIAPYVKFVSINQIRTDYLLGTMYYYKSEPSILIGGGVAIGTKINIIKNAFYIEPLFGLGGGYDSNVEWLDFDAIIYMTRIEFSVGYNFDNKLLLFK